MNGNLLTVLQEARDVTPDSAPRNQHAIRLACERFEERH